MARWNWRLISPKPRVEQTIAASGVTKASPGARVQQKWKGWMPRVRRSFSSWLRSAAAWKLPLYTSMAP